MITLIPHQIRGDLGNRGQFKDELEDVDLVTVYTDVYNMRIKLERMKKPIGTRDSPARSCKDLHHGHPQLKDGKLQHTMNLWIWLASSYRMIGVELCFIHCRFLLDRSEFGNVGRRRQSILRHGRRRENLRLS